MMFFTISMKWMPYQNKNTAKRQEMKENWIENTSHNSAIESHEPTFFPTVIFFVVKDSSIHYKLKMIITDCLTIKVYLSIFYEVFVSIG